MGGGGTEVWEMGSGGGGWDPKVCVPKWPDKIFPIGNFVVSHDGPFGRGGWVAGGYPLCDITSGVPPPLPLVYGHSNTSLRGGGGAQGGKQAQRAPWLCSVGQARGELTRSSTRFVRRYMDQPVLMLLVRWVGDRAWGVGGGVSSSTGSGGGKGGG